MDPLFPTGMGDRRGCSSQGQRLAGSYMVLKVSVKNTELNLTQSPAELGGGGALITVTGPSSSDRNSSRAKKRRTALSQHSHILPFPTPLLLPPPPHYVATAQLGGGVCLYNTWEWLPSFSRWRNRSSQFRRGPSPKSSAGVLSAGVLVSHSRPSL